jgi:hypothetical protein
VTALRDSLHGGCVGDYNGGAVPDARFGDLTVVRTGVVAGATARRPRGYPGAVCDCSCGAKGVLVPVYRLLNGNTTTCGHGKCTSPQPNPDRIRILEWLAEHGPARLTDLAAAVGMTTGACGGQITLMLRAGQVERPFRGVICLPGQAPAEPLPVHPGRVAGNAKAGRSRWENMTGEERKARIAALAAGRVRAAEERRRAASIDAGLPGAYVPAKGDIL